jgi:uncharacterized repeat protein (TIGR03837 family)
MMARSWDIFCRLVDNLGDVGVCWRLAADLASRGEHVRLWMDDAAPLAFMAPQGSPGVQVLPWPSDSDPIDGVEPGEVVIEAFGCDVPHAFVARMAQQSPPPVWINLEYLGVEDFARRSHGLPSPQLNGLQKWFFYPGFATGTGGLLREPALLKTREAFDRDEWLDQQGVRRQTGERVVLLFCYEQAPFAALLQALASQPTLLLLAQGNAQRLAQALKNAAQWPHAHLRSFDLPWLTQTEFDRALWSADLNCVRGEDTVVRALWAGAPLIWQLYPQAAQERELKLRAWLGHFFPGTRPGQEPKAPLYREWLHLHRRYNGLDGTPASSPLFLPDLQAWGAQVHQLRGQIAAQSDLCTQLQGFVASKS